MKQNSPFSPSVCANIVIFERKARKREGTVWGEKLDTPETKNACDNTEGKIRESASGVKTVDSEGGCDREGVRTVSREKDFQDQDEVATFNRVRMNRDLKREGGRGET